MRPPSVYAKRSCPAGDPCDLLALLHGPRDRLPPGHDPVVPTRLVGGHHRRAAGLRPAHRAPVPGPPGHQPAHPAPTSPRGRLLAATPAGRTRRPRPRPGPGRAAAGHRHPAPGRGGGAGRRRDPPQPAAVGALELDHQRLPPAGHDPGTNRRRTIFGAVDVSSGRFVYQVCRKAVSASFTAFCEQLLAAYPTAPVVAVVCDNVIIHRSKLVQRWLAAHPWVRVLHGRATAPTTTRSSASGARSRPTSPTRRRPPWPGGSAKCTPSFRQRSPAQLLATAAPRSSPGSPTDTDRTFGRLSVRRRRAAGGDPRRQAPPGPGGRRRRGPAGRGPSPARRGAAPGGRG
jgi:hypothetical protein